MKSLGFSEGFHDAAVAVLDGDEILFASHSERFSRKKNDKHVSKELVDHVSKHLSGLKTPEIAFYERPIIKRTRQAYAGQYKEAFGFRTLAFTPTAYFSHHLSHAAVAFQCSPFKTASAIIIDAIGEWDTVSTWDCCYVDGKAEYTKKGSVRYPTSLGLFYSAVTDRIGLKPNEEEYITMGMAAYGKTNSKLYGKLRDLLANTNLHRGMKGELLEYEDEDIAYNAQILTQNIIKSFINKQPRNKPLVYGGGVALNSVANGMLFKGRRHFIFPNPGDAGSALGAAALVNRQKIKWDHSFHGYDLPLLTQQQVKEVVEALVAGEAVGVAAGKAEYGPRALGNRSLLCDPRTSANKDKVNEVKKRQKFRPFAPSILTERAQKHFRTMKNCNYDYMQYVVKCTDSNFLATMHVDSTARVHTVSRQSSEVSSLRDILECWFDKTHCPTLLNTSLNIKGQPMVNNIQDAVDFEKTYGVKVFHG
jgi:carbamoyltransferase